MGQSYAHQSQEDDCWEVKIETIEKCSKAPEEIRVYMAPIVKAKINALMEKFSHCEWFSYLIGEKITNDDYLIQDLLIPKQTVSSASVTNVICPEFNEYKIIGAMHSHHSMGNSFSPTDDNWVNQNHNISLVVATDGIAGHVRWKTPCGGMLIVPAKVLPYIDVEFDKELFYKSELGKIQRPKAQVFPHINPASVSVPVQTEIEEEDNSLLTALQEAYPDIDTATESD